MILVKQTQTQLKLLYRPYLVWIVTGSLIFGIPLLIWLISLNDGWILYLWWMPIFFPSIIILGILGLIFYGQVVTCKFDKDSDSLTIKRRGLLNTQVIRHSLGDILDVQVQSTSWSHDETANYQIVVFLRNRNKLILKIEFISTKDKLETVNLIRKFLGMPPQTLKWLNSKNILGK
jgi:hypothetical protein